MSHDPTQPRAEADAPRVRQTGHRVACPGEYRTPTLAVYGRLADVTAAKGGNRNDGSGKPRTRGRGGPA
jgi:hypothetical protein